MKRSFKSILVLTYGLLILLTVVVLDLATILSVKNYFYRDTSRKAKSQAELNLNYLYRYIDFSKGLDNVILEDASTIYEYNAGHIIILNNDGENILSTMGIRNDIFDVNSIESSIERNGYFTSIDNFDYADNKLVSVALPIKLHGNNIGTVIFQYDMTDAENSIKNIQKILILLSFVVLAIALAISFYMSNKIVGPLGKLKEYASKLAGGNYSEDIVIKGSRETVTLGETMKYMASEINKRDEIKNEFIASVSHELKTPLTSIKGWAYTLNADSSDPELVKEGLNIIEKETDRLTGMVNDLLDFSRLLNNKVELLNTNFDLNEHLEGIVSQFTPRSITENKNLSFISKVNKANFKGDENRLRQVFINLLDNAFKFTSPEGNVLVILDEKDDYYCVTVADDGEGMDENDVPHIFEKFYRGHSRNSHAGIGLSIVYEIVNLHGGYIKVKSKKKEGSKFEIYLPKVQK